MRSDPECVTLRPVTISGEQLTEKNLCVVEELKTAATGIQNGFRKLGCRSKLFHRPDRW